MAEQAYIRTFIAPLIGAGRLAPTLLEDVTLYDPRQPSVHENLLSSTPTQFGSVSYLQQALPQNSCQHAFYIQPRQTKRPELDERPKRTSKYWIAAFCRHCRIHLLLTVDYTIRWKDSPCPTEGRPVHHLVFSQYNTDLAQQTQRRQFAQNQFEVYVYECSAPQCSAIVTIRLGAPELREHHIHQLLDPELLKNRTDEAFELHKANTEGMKRPTPVDVLMDLKAYLSNAWDKDARLEISFDNKRFAVRFGPRGKACEQVLTDLGFVLKESSWQVPQPRRGEDGNIIPSLQSTYLDNIESELNALILSRPVEERQASHDQTRLDGAGEELARALGCQNYDRSPLSRSSKIQPALRPLCFLVLGAPQDASDELVEFAFDRQCDMDPEFTPTYMLALKDIHSDRGTETLQMKIAIEESRGKVDWHQLSASYNALGIPPHGNIDAEHIIGTFNSRLQDSPAQESELRQHLRVIGEGRRDQKIKDYAARVITTYDQALDFLGTSDSTDDSWIQTLYATKVYENPNLQELAAKAVNVIANHRRSEVLQAFAASGFSTKVSSEMDIGEAYSALEIPDRTIEDDFILTVYKMRRGDDSANADRYIRALKTIAQSRQSSILLQELQMTPQVETNLNEPVGLENIGNTCYLNSLLQFLFTVKELRDILLDFDSYKLDPTPEILQTKRVGQRKISALEVEHGQKFAARLGDLFQSMITAPKLAIRPEQELARLTLETDQVKEKIRRRSTLGAATRPHLGVIDDNAVQGPLPAPAAPEDGPHQPSLLTIPAESDAVADDDSTKAVGSSPIDFEMDAHLTGDGDNSSEATLVSRPGSDDDLNMETNVEQQQSIFDNKENLSPGKIDEPKSTSQGLTEPLRPASPSKVNIQAGALESKTNQNTTGEGESIPIYQPPPGPPPIPPRKPVQTSAAQLEEYARQQDVTEVVNHCLFQLSTAMRPKGFDDSGEQQDEVHDLFFGKARMHTVPEKELRQPVPFLNINANVSNKPKDVYAALDNYFDLSEADIGQKSYFSITKLPPILTIALTRVVWDAATKSQKKLQNHVEMPECIYMDRYLEANEDSSVMQMRKRSWQLKQRLSKLEEQLQFFEQSHAGSKDVASLFDDAKMALRYLASLNDQNDLYGTPIEIDPGLITVLGGYAEDVRKQIDQLKTEHALASQELAESFAGMAEHPYILHAAFFHRGSHGSGHYWIYIKDQLTGIWRKYNDEYVTIVEDVKDIFQEPQPTSPNAAVPTPYVLVYIQAGTETEPLEKLVETIKREAVRVEENDSELIDLEPLGSGGLGKAPSQMTALPPESQPSAHGEEFNLPSGEGGSGSMQYQDLWDSNEADIDPHAWYRKEA